MTGRRRWRGQLTIPDVVLFAAALVILSGLAPVFYALLNENASEFSTGTVMLYQLVVPGLVMTLLVIVFAIATGGEA